MYCIQNPSRANTIPNCVNHHACISLEIFYQFCLRYEACGSDNIVVNAGGYIRLVSVKTTTGDPAGGEGVIYINTADNVIRMYADGAFRTIASW